MEKPARFLNRREISPKKEKKIIHTWTLDVRISPVDLVDMNVAETEEVPSRVVVEKFRVLSRHEATTVEV